MRGLVVWSVPLIAMLAVACKGEGDLKAALTPKKGAHISFYRLGSLRCPYWIPAFEAADGQKGGYQCVNRVTLREMCAIADCEMKPGTPNNLPPGLIDRSKGGPGWKGKTSKK
jgi:hypothetical protein